MLWYVCSNAAVICMAAATWSHCCSRPLLSMMCMPLCSNTACLQSVSQSKIPEPCMLLPGGLLFGTCIADAGKSAKSMARGGQGLPREMGGDPLDLLDAGTSRKMVKHAAAARGAAAAGPAHEEEDEFEHADDGKMIIRVCWLPCGKELYRPQGVQSLLDPACKSRARMCWHSCSCCVELAAAIRNMVILCGAASSSSGSMYWRYGTLCSSSCGTSKACTMHQHLFESTLSKASIFQLKFLPH